MWITNYQFMIIPPENREACLWNSYLESTANTWPYKFIGKKMCRKFGSVLTVAQSFPHAFAVQVAI